MLASLTGYLTLKRNHITRRDLLGEAENRCIEQLRTFVFRHQLVIHAVPCHKADCCGAELVIGLDFGLPVHVIGRKHREHEIIRPLHRNLLLPLVEVSKD